MSIAVPGPVTPGWIAAGALLHLLNQLARGRGWLALLRDAVPGGLRTRNVLAAWVAGAGSGGVLSARGGDGVRLLMVGRRLTPPRYRVLAGTLAAEAAGESVLGLGVAAAAVATGVWAVRAPEAGDAVPLLAVLAAVGLALALRRTRGLLRRLAAEVGHGVGAAGSPGRYARRVLPWQLASRALRLVAIGCFLAGFGVPVAGATVLLLAVAQGGGRLLPFGPAAAAASSALVAAAAPGGSAETLVGCLLAMTATLTLMGCVTAGVCVVWTSDLRWVARHLPRARRSRTAAVSLSVSPGLAEDAERG